MSEIISKEEKHKQLELENSDKTHISFSEFSLYNQRNISELNLNHHLYIYFLEMQYTSLLK